MKSPRTPTIRACIKRLSSLTIVELKGLKDRELYNILNLEDLFPVIRTELAKRILEDRGSGSVIQEEATNGQQL